MQIRRANTWISCLAISILLGGCGIFGGNVTGSHYDAQTPAKAVVVGSDGNIYLVGQTADKQNNATIVDRKTLKVIGTTTIEIKTINGVNYFEFEGHKYHADPPR